MSMLYLGNHKRCSKCGKYKDMATEYYKSKSAPRGVVARCKECAKRHKYRDRQDHFWKFYWSRVERVGTCLEWRGAMTNHDSAPGCKWKGKHTTVRRVVYELRWGEIPSDMFILTTCDNSRCVSQYHMTLGTKTDREVERCNSILAGEQLRTRKSEIEHAKVGTIDHRKKLTDVGVRDIRWRASKGESLLSISSVYRVHPRTVAAVLSGKTWKYVQ